jgi:hypothetical protein
MVAPASIGLQASADNPKPAVWCIQHGSSWRVYLIARVGSPWFWEERKGWYVSKDGQRHFLGAHPEGAPITRKHKGTWNVSQVIVQAFHLLTAAPWSSSSPKHLQAADRSLLKSSISIWIGAKSTGPAAGGAAYQGPSCSAG